MNKTQINNQIKRIAMMDRTQLDDFTRKVHNAVEMPEDTFKAFMTAIDARHKALANSFNFEVEAGELKSEEIQ